MGRLFIAEKPELARAIAKGLIGNESKGNFDKRYRRRLESNRVRRRKSI